MADEFERALVRRGPVGLRGVALEPALAGEVRVRFEGLPDDQPLADLIYAALDGLTFGTYADDDPARARAALGRLQELLGFLARQKWEPGTPRR